MSKAPYIPTRSEIAAQCKQFLAVNPCRTVKENAGGPRSDSSAVQERQRVALCEARYAAAMAVVESEPARVVQLAEWRRGRAEAYAEAERLYQSHSKRY